MRFWPFGKRRGGDQGPPEPPPTRAADAATADPAPTSPPASAPPPQTAWRELPPLRAVASDFPISAPVQRLTDHLTPVQETRVASDRLSHATGALGPAGTTTGLVGTHAHRVHGGDALRFAHAPEPVAAEDAVPLRPWGSSTPITVSSPARSTPVQRLAHHPSDAAPSGRPPDASGSVAAVERPALGADRATATSGTPLGSLPTISARPLRSLPTPASPPDVPAPAPGPVDAGASVPPTAESGGRTSATELPTVQRLPAAEPAEEPAATVTRSVETSETPGRSRPDAPTLGSTRIVRRVGAPLAARPASMVEPGEASPDTGSVREPLPLPPVAPPVVSRPAPGALPEHEVRPLPVGATASTGPTPVGAGPPQRLPFAPAAGSDRPTVGARAPIQRLDATPPVLTAVPRAATPAEARSAVPVRRGVQRAPESVPPAVRSEVEPVLGESLDDVKVHRGPEVGDAARAIGAKAFAAGGEVFLPDEHGSAATGEGSRILKHELTHVVQQRALGGALPAEDSVAGAAMEAEARRVGGQDPAPATSAQPIVPPVRARPTAAAPQRLAGVRPPDPVRPLAAAGVTGPAATRPPPSALPVAAQAAIVAKVQAAAAGAGVPTSASVAVPQPATSTTSSPAPSRPAGDVVDSTQRLPATSTATPSPRGGVSIDEITTEVAPAAAAPDLDSLERQLYPRFRSRLRHDLLADRERAGRLFDTR